MSKNLLQVPFIVTLLLTCNLCLSQSSYSPNRFLIVFEEGISQAEIDTALVHLNCKEIWVSPISSTRLWQVNYFPFVYPPSNSTIYNINEESSTARSRAEVQEAGLDYESEGIPDFTDIGLPSGGGNDLQMDCYGQLSTSTATDLNVAEVGVFDTGFTYPSNPQIQDYYFDIDNYIEYDYLENDPIAEDYHGHGTHISSVIAHLTNKDSEINSYLNPDVSYNMCKTFDSGGIGYIAEIIFAFETAALNNLQIANFSWSFKETREEAELSPLRHSLESVLELHDILIICASGNDGVDIDDPTNIPNWPAAYSFNNILTVGTYDCTGDVTSFSNYGENSVDIVAPGFKIPGLTSEGLVYKTGTSQSTAIVTAVAAALATHQINFNAEHIKCAIMSSATTTDDLSTKIVSKGYLDADLALSILGFCDPTIRSKNSVTTSEIFPNPVHDIIRLRMSEQKRTQYNISVINQIGQLVQKNSIFVESGENEISLPVEFSATGIYILELSSNTGGERVTKKFIKM